MDNSYLSELQKVLQSDERLVNADGKLLKSKITEFAQNLDEVLIELLLTNDKLRKFFFKVIADVTVFDIDKFLNFVHNEAFLADSFTAFKNKIGLATSNNDYISERSEVVLNWPYRDCILEGGQDKEDQKRDEIFWNETLGADQRDVLLAPKVLTGFKRYDKEGVHGMTVLKDEDNFIIRGNNLLALYTLKKRFAGKVSLIYIDPPFNTENDSFMYNDKFMHATWLTFMRNRLLIAKDLLVSGGCIFVQLDFNESHYGKVLMDEIFGRDNFKNEIIWAYGAGGNPKNFFPRKHDTILFYSNSHDNQFNKDDEVMHTPFNKSTLDMHFGNIDKNGRNYRIQKVNGKEYITYADEGKLVTDVWTDIGAQNATSPISSESTGFSTQKPERLMQRIISSCTKPGDIILDYHIGSGTTCAVAHKMKRQYIGIEQMGYIEDVTIKRLNDVIAGEQGGISKAVGWLGGGSFVYAYLQNDANTFIQSVEKTKDSEGLENLLDTVLKSNFLSYRVDQKKLEKDKFAKLPFVEQKRLLIDLVNKNKLYVNYHDMDDVDYKIDQTTKDLNKWMQSKA